LELGELAERKLQAFQKHRSQQGVLERAGGHVRDAMRFERYLLAAQRGVASVMADAGMFAGVVEDGR
jgi:hypothetical protein